VKKLRSVIDSQAIGNEKQDKSVERKEHEDCETLNLAYQRALSAEDTITKCFDAIDGRLQTLLTFVVSTTVLVPTIATQRGGLSFHSLPFEIAIGAAFLAILTGTYARSTGELLVFHPAELEEHWLKLAAPEFKKYMIRKAGRAFEKNLRLINYKWVLSVIVSLVFFLEALALSGWVALGVPRAHP
jgi:hypothetical protein